MRKLYKNRPIVSLSLIFCMLLSLLPESVAEAATSTRYVWEKSTPATYSYSKGSSQTLDSESIIMEDGTYGYMEDDGSYSGTPIILMLEFSSDSGNFIITETVNIISTDSMEGWMGQATTVSSGSFFAITGMGGIWYTQIGASVDSKRHGDTVYYAASDVDVTRTSGSTAYHPDRVHLTGTVQETTTTKSGGESLGYVSSSSSSAYPEDGISGSYQYEYQGSDCIDPTAVTYSTSNLTAGSSITAKVTARSNTYGGTISYRYQYSTDGGSTWTTAGTTTSKSKAITVPSGTTSFAVRVRASDNYGFTSSTNVYGDTLTAVAANITWDASTNGGTIDGGSSTTTSVNVGDVAAAPSSEPIKSGYSFKGWYTAVSGGSSYADVTVAGDTTYYAQFTPNSYVITWDNGDGTSDTTNQTFDDSVVFPETSPKKEGYTFTGWYTASTGGTKITSNTVYQIAGNSTYYAQFSLNSYEITWDDGQGGIQTTNQDYNTNLALPASPSKTGHTFVGWFTQSSGGTQVNNNTVYATAGSTTYYAQYRANSYTIIWDHGNSETETSSQVYGANLVLPSTEPTKENSVFAGWYTAASGGTKVDANTVYNNAGDVTYYGQWLQVFSVTVPATLPIGMDQDGNIYTSTDVGVDNHSSGDVKVSFVYVSGKNGWSVVPYGTNMANEKVDSKQVGLRINGSDTTIKGSAEYLTLDSEWIIGEGASLVLDYDAVFSASSSQVTGTEVLDIVFVVGWN